MRFIIFLVSITCYLNASAQYISGKITRVIDGDTFIFTTDSAIIKVRMQGIDAPELHQFYGQESKQFLLKFRGIPGTIFKYKIDKYGRSVAMLYIDTVNINLLELHSGQAWYYYQYYKSKAFYDAEQIARSQRLGLWHYSNPIPPWIFRKSN